MHIACITSILLLCACGPRERLKWDSTSSGDVGEDFVVALFGLGTTEGDRSELVGPHVTGSQRAIDAVPRGNDDARGWRAEVLDDTVVDVTGFGGRDRLELNLSFLREGTTEMFVTDEQGAVKDVQMLRVRDPVRVDLVPWEEVVVARAEGRTADGLGEGAAHTLQGGRVDLIVTWLDRTDRRLAGGGITVLSDTPPRIGTEVVYTNRLDILELDVGDNAPVGVHPVDFFADARPVATRDIVVHDVSEVDAVQLDVQPAAGQGEGTAHAIVRTADTPLLGIPVRFGWGDQSEEGIVLLFQDDGEATPITACFGEADAETCAEAVVPGTPTGVAGREAIDPSGCNCSTGPTGVGTGPWLLGLLPWWRRRRATR